MLLFAAFVSMAKAASVTLAWDASTSPDVAGYRIYFGPTSGSYSGTVEAGNFTTNTILGLSNNSTTFFAVTAYDIDGIESDFSNEIKYDVLDSSPTIVLTSPVDGSSYVAPTTINLAATATANGHSIAKVQFYSGSILLGEAAAPPFNFAWNKVISGNYNPMARLVYDNVATLDSPLVNVIVNGLPAPWQLVDIGNPAVAGSAGLSANLYTLNGGGTFTNISDSFSFVYEPLSADADISIRLGSMLNTNSSASGGVMIRESLASGSKYVFMGISGSFQLLSQRRSSTSGATLTTLSTVVPTSNVWLRLTRTGGTFKSFSSLDGINWNLVSSLRSKSITMATNIYFGIAASSNVTNSINRITFDHLTAVP